jgi:hypothetical protein
MYPAGYCLEYLGNLESEVTMIAELHVGQIAYVKAVGEEREYEYMKPKEQYNKMLDYLLSQIGRSKIVLLRQTINKTTTDTARISLLANGECHPTDGTWKSSNISKITVKDTSYGDFGDAPGLPVQHVFSCPFEKTLSLKHVKLVEAAFSGTTRSSVTTMGSYQNVGARSTTQCSAAMGAHPNTKQSHHNWNQDMNGSLVPAVSSIRNTRLMWLCSLVVQYYLLNSELPECIRYVEKLKRANVGTNLPLETGCFWTLAQKNDKHEMRQGFANLAAGTILGLSSSAFNLRLHQSLAVSFLGRLLSTVAQSQYG